jgi:hypothetical protein
VGEPIWSLTTGISDFSSISRSIVFTKFFPYEEYTHEERMIVVAGSKEIAWRSPCSFEAP